MQANLLRIAALACSWLIAAPLPSCAQSAGDRTDNAAAAPLQRAVASAIAVSFSPSLAPEADPQSQTKSPPSNPAAPSLQDLGIFPTQVKGNPREQRRLNKRSHMLKIHQKLGLITVIPMVAALITGPRAKAKGRHGQLITEPTPANLDTHIALGALTASLYVTTAYYAIFAPKIAGVKPRGAIRLHRDLAWVHGAGMILTGVLGIMAYRQENAGEKVHGIASMHGTAAYVTALAYGASIVSVSWPIHWKFWR